MERAASCAAQGQTRQQAPDPQAPARPLPGCRKSFSPLAWYSLTEEEWPAPGWPAPGVRHLGRGWGRPRGRASLSSACRPPLPAFPPPPARSPPHRAVTLPPAASGARHGKCDFLLGVGEGAAAGQPRAEARFPIPRDPSARPRQPKPRGALLQAVPGRVGLEGWAGRGPPLAAPGARTLVRQPRAPERRLGRP